MNRRTEAVPSRASQRGRSWPAILFGLVFFGVGMGFLLFGIAPSIYDATRMSSWASTPAQLETARLEVNRSDDSDTYRVVARYRYEYHGHEYTGERVGIHGGSDNVGSWQQTTYRRLRSGPPLTVWVNPDNPTEAVYDRALRWEMLGFQSIFVVLFGAVGAGVMWIAARKAQPAPAPEMPAWQWRKEWRDNRIPSSARMTMWVAWFFALVWNTISAPVIFVVPGEVAKGNHAVLFGLLFPLVGVGIIVFALRQTLQWRRFGPTLLTLDPFPGSLGAGVGGTLELKLPFNPRYVFNATLTCNYVYTRRSGKNRSTERKVLWQDAQRAHVEPGLRGTRIRFNFQVPPDLPESEEPDSSYHEWALDLSAELPGADFDRRFEIPVFATGQRRVSSTVKRNSEMGSVAAELPARTVRIRETGSGLTLEYPVLRNVGAAVTAIAVGGVFSAVGWLLPVFVKEDGPPLPMLIIFGLVGALVLLAGLYMAGNSLRVTASSNGLTTVRRIFGFSVQRKVTSQHIVSIDKDVGMQSSSGARTRAWYRIRVRTADGRTLAVGDSLPSASAANAVIVRLRRALGLSADAAEQTGSSTDRHANAAVPEAKADVRRRGKAVRWVAIAIGFGIFLWQAKDVLLALMV